MAQYIVLTIAEVSKKGDFVNFSILQQMTETLEQILRIEGVIKLIEREDFADAVGNLMTQLGERAYVARIQSKYGTVDEPKITWTS